MRNLIAGLFTAALFIGCELDTGEDPVREAGGGDGGGSGGQSGGGGGGQNSSGKSATSGSSNAGTAPGAGQAGSAGSAGKGTSGDTGSGGSAVGGSGGTSNGGKGSGGGNLGGAGSSNAGTGGQGPQAGSGGTSTAGTASGGNAGSGGSGECVENIGCELDAPPSTGDLHQDCVDRINQFRTECACLPPLERWTEGEDCADQMSEYDSIEDRAHAGFGDDICPGGSAQNECPGYRSNTQVIELCLQQMWDEGPPPQDPCEDDCFQEYGHFINMTNERYTKVACGFFTTPEGEVWAAQNFSR